MQAISEIDRTKKFFRSPRMFVCRTLRQVIADDCIWGWLLGTHGLPLGVRVFLGPYLSVAVFRGCQGSLSLIRLEPQTWTPYFYVHTLRAVNLVQPAIHRLYNTLNSVSPNNSAGESWSGLPSAMEAGGGNKAGCRATSSFIPLLIYHCCAGAYFRTG